MYQLMVRKSGLFLMVCLLFTGAILTAAMEDDQTQSQQQDQTQRQKQDASTHLKAKCEITGRAGNLQSTDAIIGMDVKNKQGQTLGEIEEVILNDTRQAVEYIIVSANDNLYPVPWKAVDTGAKTYVLDISAGSLRQAPTINSLDSSQLENESLREKSHNYYQEQISAVEDKNIGERAVDWVAETTGWFDDETAPMIYSANQIIGFDVQNPQGETLGELNDILFDVREGNLAYGLVSFGGVLGIGEEIAAVPWEAIELSSNQKVAVIDADEQTLQAAMLRNGDIQRLLEPTFARQVHRQFDEEPYWIVFGFIAPTPEIGTRPTGAVSDDAWKPDSAYNRNFNTDTMETIQGTIKQVGSFKPAENASAGLKLKVETQDGRVVAVYAGPKNYYMQQQVRFRKGDQVAVTGSQTSIDEKNVIIASQIKTGDQTFELRDSNGNPAWKVDSSRQKQQQDERMEEMTDEEADMEKDTPPRYY